MSEIDATGMCTPTADGGLDGAVIVTLDGTVTTYDALGDGTHQFTATAADAAYAIDAVVACDGDSASVTVAVTGVGVALPPTDVADAVMYSAMPTGALATMRAAAPDTLPATGAASGSLVGVALALVAAGALLRRVARRLA